MVVRPEAAIAIDGEAERKHAKVQPYVRVVPGGIERLGGRSYLHATVLITPDAEGAGVNSTYHLSHWTGDVIRAVRRGLGPKLRSDDGAQDDDPWTVPLLIIPAICRKDATGLLCRARPEAVAPPQPIGAAAFRMARAFPRDVRIVEADELWRLSLMGNRSGEEAPWTNLATAIAASLGGGGPRPGKIEEPADHTYQEPEMGADGQIAVAGDPNKGASVDTILPVRQSDLALEIERQRVEELLVSLREACGDQSCRLSVEEARIERQRKLLEDRRRDVLDESTKLPHTLSPDRKSVTNADVQSGLAERKRRLREDIFNSRALRSLREAAHTSYKEAIGNQSANTCGVRDLSVAWRDRKIGLGPETDGDDATAFEDAAAAHTYATWPQYSDAERTAEADDLDSWAQRTFFAMQTNPTISRLFGLAIDVRVNLDDVTAQDCFGDPHRRTSMVDGASEEFVFLCSPMGLDAASAHGGTVHRALPWSLAKLRYGGSTRQDHFWPATIEEVSALPGSPCRAENLPQFEGHIVMGAGAQAEGGAARFDLTSLDIRTATELENQRRSNRDAEIQSPGDKRFQAADDLAYPTALQTAGLSILDRGVQTQVARKLAARVAKTEASGDGDPAACAAGIGRPTAECPAGQVILDAEDLTIGFRVDTGLPVRDLDSESSEVAWRALSSRIIDYGTSGAARGEALNTTLKTLTDGWSDSDFRWSLDSAQFALASRLLPNSAGGDDSNPVECVVEEAIAVWTGAPMGVECIDDLVDQDGADIISRDTFAFGRTLRLPSASMKVDPAIRPPYLRFRRPYRFKMRAVYQGGLCRPPDAGADADKRLDGKLFYPVAAPGDVKPFFRYLRQNWIDAPNVLMRGQDAVRLHGERGVMGPENGADLLVRTVIGPEADTLDRDTLRARRNDLNRRRGPISIVRRILPPASPFEDVSHHGVFDGDRTRRPAGAFSGVNYDAKNGGFPVTVTEMRRGFNGQRHFARRSVGFPDTAGEQSSDVLLGSGVYTAQSGLPKGDYYPDPAAHTIAFGLRIPGEKEYLPIVGDAPIFADLRVPGQSYPDLRTCELRVQADPSAERDGRPSLNDIARITSQPGNRNLVSVLLRLAPGESFEVDMWCVPSVETLAAEMSLVQSLALYLHQHGVAEGAGGLEACVRGVTDIIGDALGPEGAETIAAAIAEIRTGAGAQFVGPGGLTVPPTSTLTAIARILRGVMLRRPINEFSSIKTVRATHAVERPQRKYQPVLHAAPADRDVVETFPETPGDPAPLTLYRPSQKTLEEAEASSVRKFTAGDIAVATGSTEAVIAGSIDLALDVSDGFELTAEATLPATSDFDDPNQGRSLEQRRAGYWPRTLGDGDDRPYRTAKDIFGFGIARDGVTQLTRQNVVLLRVEGLPLQAEETSLGGGMWRMDLTDFTLSDGDPDKKWRVTGRHAFPDGKARRMKIRARSFSRTLPKLEIPRRMASNGRTFLPEEPVPLPLTFTTGATVDVVLPATIRPAICDVRSPMPVFHWRENRDASGAARSVTRMTRIRIPLKRGWFSSGEDERLGLVVWPPEIDFDDDEWIARDRVPVPRTPGETPDILALDEFTDDDLGPGGRYVTRMGGDPTRKAHPILEDPVRRPADLGLGALMHLGAFRDLTQRGEDGRPIAEYQPSVLMPFDDQADDPNELRPSQTMTVGLVTYAPRFDPDREAWYVDVSIDPGLLPDPFVRFGLVRFQKHAPRHLQVSRPVVHWAQVLPRRDVVVRRDQDGLDIRVTGVAAHDSIDIWRSFSPESAAAEVEQRKATPHMRFTLIRDDTTADGLALSEILAESGDVAFDGVGAEANGWISRWTTRLAIDAASGGTGSLRLHIEEIDWRRPAQYEDEPRPRSIYAPETGETEFTESGPRFIADIQIDDLVPAPRVFAETDG